ncbi:hypothetical protein [Chitinophaga sp. RAB17]
MTITDVAILTKKIAIGIFIFLIPLVIISGTIWLLHFLLNQPH